MGAREGPPHRAEDGRGPDVEVGRRRKIRAAQPHIDLEPDGGEEREVNTKAGQRDDDGVSQQVTLHRQVPFGLLPREPAAFGKIRQQLILDPEPFDQPRSCIIRRSWDLWNRDAADVDVDLGRVHPKDIVYEQRAPVLVGNRHVIYCRGFYEKLDWVS